MWVAICVPLVIGAIALVLQRMEACLDRSRAELAMKTHTAKPHPDGSVPMSGVCPLRVDFDEARVLGLVACGSVYRGLPRRRSVSR
jgi:hypothetical protein